MNERDKIFVLINTLHNQLEELKGINASDKFKDYRWVLTELQEIRELLKELIIRG